MISVVIPMFNEEEGVEILYERLIAAAKEWRENYEVILVNDGSVEERNDLSRISAVRTSG